MQLEKFNDGGILFFENINQGDSFYIIDNQEEKPLIKTESLYGANAVGLSTGSFYRLLPDTRVNCVNRHKIVRIQ